MEKVLNIGEVCDCGHTPSPHNEFSTGYGYDDEGQTMCYECCAEQDRTYLRDNGKLAGYLVGNDAEGHYFTNWPGTFRLRVRGMSKSWHNFAGKNGRTDFWVWFEGKQYHGVQIGHFNQCATIKILKRQPK